MHRRSAHHYSLMSSPPQPFRLTWPGVTSGTETGLGDLIAQATAALGIRPCDGCARRAVALNRLMVFSQPVRLRLPWRSKQTRGAATDGCWSFTGKCTGFGTRQCVEGPASQTPDAEIIHQCCGGWFQYPWIEVCPGQTATKGCGFCFG